MEYLNDDLLVEVYIKSVLLNADPKLITMLNEEIQKRGLSLEEYLEIDRD